MPVRPRLRGLHLHVRIALPILAGVLCVTLVTSLVTIGAGRAQTLSFTLSLDGPASGQAGQQVTYTITMQNASPTLVTGYVLTLTTTPPLEFISATGQAQCYVGQATGTAKWTPVTMQAGEVQTYTATFRVPWSPAICGATVAAVATLTSDKGVLAATSNTVKTPMTCLACPAARWTFDEGAGTIAHNVLSPDQHFQGSFVVSAGWSREHAPTAFPNAGSLVVNGGLNGVGGITVPDMPQPESRNAWTVSLWVKPMYFPRNGGVAPMFWKSRDIFGFHPQVIVPSPDASPKTGFYTVSPWFVWGGIPNVYNPTNPAHVFLGSWTHLAFSWWYPNATNKNAGYTMCQYVNGRPDDLTNWISNCATKQGTPSGLNPTPGDAWFDPYTSGLLIGNFIGLIDDVRIYDRVLSDSEIAALAAGQDVGDYCGTGSSSSSSSAQASAARSSSSSSSSSSLRSSSSTSSAAVSSGQGGSASSTTITVSCSSSSGKFSGACSSSKNGH